MFRRVCLSIGVVTLRAPRRESRSPTSTERLSRQTQIGQWAVSSGFGNNNVKVVTDQLHRPTRQPVTIDRVQAAVDACFAGEGTPTDHLILSFCGHGLTADVGSTFLAVQRRS